MILHDDGNRNAYGHFVVGLSIVRLQNNDNINIFGIGSGNVDWTDVRNYGLPENDSMSSELPGFWTFSIVRYSRD
jgi:hypothetical protein